MKKLLELIEFEKKIQNKKVINNINIVLKHQFLPPFTHRNILNVDVEIQVDREIFHTKMNKIFIHQIGKRIYGDEFENDYYPLFQAWVKDFNENYQYQINRINDAFIKHNLIIRFYALNNKNVMYGIVSEKYQSTDQISFREKFIDIASDYENIRTDNSQMYSVSSGPGSSVKEYFDFSIPSSDVQLKCGISYGLNNGYGAYTVHWLRQISDSNTWLTPWKSEQEFKWKNNPRFHDKSSNEEMIKFVEFIVDQGISHSNYIERIVRESKSKEITVKDLNDFMNLIRIAEATKIRIKNKLAEEILSKGNTLFSFSESIRHIGTFDKYTGKETKRLLIEIGTNILEEEGLNARIDEGVNISLTGNYDWY